MKFAKIVFRIAGIWGFLVIAPLYFIADLIGKKDPPPLTHLAFYYGFVGVALVGSERVRGQPEMVLAGSQFLQ